MLFRDHTLLSTLPKERPNVWKTIKHNIRYENSCCMPDRCNQFMCVKNKKSKYMRVNIKLSVIYGVADPDLHFLRNSDIDLLKKKNC